MSDPGCFLFHKQTKLLEPWLLQMLTFCPVSDLCRWSIILGKCCVTSAHNAERSGDIKHNRKEVNHVSDPGYLHISGCSRFKLFICTK